MPWWWLSSGVTFADEVVGASSAEEKYWMYIGKS